MLLLQLWKKGEDANEKAVYKKPLWVIETTHRFLIYFYQKKDKYLVSVFFMCNSADGLNSVNFTSLSMWVILGSLNNLNSYNTYTTFIKTYFSNDNQ